MMKSSKRLIRLVIVSFGAVSVVSFLFMRSSSSLREGHQDVLNRLGRLRAQDSIFKTEVFRSRTFMTQNFDALVKSTETLRDYCQSVVTGPSALTDIYGSEFDRLLRSYCSSVDERIEMAEELKSSVSVVRNSSHYLPELSETAVFQQSSTKKTVMTAVLVSTLSYLSGRSADAALRLKKDITRLEQIRNGCGRRDPICENLLHHARTVAKLVPIIDGLLYRISDDAARDRMLAVQPAYLEVFAAIERKARFFQISLVISFIGILFFSAFLLIKLWRSTEALAAANSNLEVRVTTRTRELNETLEIVREQQASLVQSSKLSALGEMAGGIAHEINTPLATISLSIQNLRLFFPEGKETDEFAIELCNNIDETTARIEKIVNGLRKISRDEELEAPTNNRLVQIVDDTLSLCKERFNAHGTHFTVLPFDPLLSLSCRPVQISQVLLNLLNNSHDAIQGLTEQWIKLEVTHTREFTEIAVTDSGEGIPESIRNKVMQPFFTTKPVGKGTGLGLSLSSSIMKGHGGELVIDESSPHTKFVLRFPRTTTAFVAA